MKLIFVGFALLVDYSFIRAVFRYHLKLARKSMTKSEFAGAKEDNRNEAALYYYTSYKYLA